MATIKVFDSNGVKELKCFDTLDNVAYTPLEESETIEDDDNMDTKAMKALLKYKIRRIEDLEAENKDLKAALAEEKVKYHEKLDKEREQHQKSVDFLKNQIDLKDKRMDQLLEAVFKKDALYNDLLGQVLKDKP